jgi:tetratricopeptide (TPR) repeat protein
MPTFLWSGKDAEGRQRNERVETENAQSARTILSGRGWTELELLKDEVGYSEALHIEPNPPNWLKEEFEEEFKTQNTPDQEAAFLKGKTGSDLLDQTWTTIKKSFGTILICAAFLGLGIYKHRAWLMIIGSVGLAVIVFLTPVLHLVFSFFARSSHEYTRLNKAKVWARWDEVLNCVEQLRHADRLTGAAVPEVELARCRAQALGALGRLEEGLQEFRKFENNPKVEHWLYLSFLAGIYDTARQFEKGLELRQQAATEKPDTSAVWIDIAYSLVRGLNRPVEAREALARAEVLEITGLGKHYLPFLKGIILWREGKPLEAKVELERARAGFEPMIHHALVEGLVLLTKSYLCAVHNQLGNLSESSLLFREVEKYLLAHREDDLLKACCIAPANNL